MKPVPFDDEYEYQEPSSGKWVVSTEAFGTKVLDSDGSTVLYDIPGVFSGRRTISLSSDGTTLIFDGNLYFGDQFLRTPQVDDNEVVTEIYYQGQLWKEVSFKTDLNDGHVMILHNRFRVRGGGWVTRMDVIHKTAIDWKKGVIAYTMTTEADAAVKFVCEIDLPTAPPGGPTRSYREGILPKNTAKVYQPRWAEWYQYCEACYSGEVATGDVYSIRHDKLLNFMFYQCMREKRKAGRGRASEQQHRFSLDDYTEVINRHQGWLQLIQNDVDSATAQAAFMPEPANPLKADSIYCYKAAMKWLHQDHVVQNITSLTWDEIWTPSLKFLISISKKRRPEKKRKKERED
jgi:hypothetical protein